MHDIPPIPLRNDFDPAKLSIDVGIPTFCAAISIGNHKNAVNKENDYFTLFFKKFMA